jgi:hypothetical protein
MPCNTVGGHFRRHPVEAEAMEVYANEPGARKSCVGYGKRYATHLYTACITTVRALLYCKDVLAN